MSVDKVAKDCLKFSEGSLTISFNSIILCKRPSPSEKNLNEMHVALNARTRLRSVPLLLKRFIGRLLGKERLQTAICCLECLGEIKKTANGSFSFN